MRMQRSHRFRFLWASLGIWLLCAWVAQQPSPRPKPKAPASRVAAPLKKAQQPATPAETLKTGSIDPESELVVDKDMFLVKGQCTACHSSKLILQSHFDRDKWIERIRWMQRTQKLWDLGESEPAILAYLTKYYGPLDVPFDGRRLPLAKPQWYRVD